MKSTKKGQVSSFIIVGIVLILILGMLLYVTDNYIQTKINPQKTIENQGQLLPIEKQIVDCLEKTSLPLIQTIAKQGGTFNISENSISNYGDRFALHYTPKLGNILITKNSVEKELASEIFKNISQCIDLPSYTKLGYNIENADQIKNLNLGPNSINVSITDLQVIVRLNYPLKLSKEDEILSKDNFVAKIDLPLGKFLDSARDITNSEIQTNSYDLDYYRINSNEIQLSTNSKISIIKKKPYPYVIYQISYGDKSYSDENINNSSFAPYLLLNFGIEKSDLTNLKFSNPALLFSENLNEGQGSCIIGNSCYSYVFEKDCARVNGSFYIGEKCSISNKKLSFSDIAKLNLKDSSDIDSAKSKLCDGYYDLNSGNFKQAIKFNGESWCVYEKGVGSRSYKLSCVDGKVIVEQCSDFKDELCAEEKTALSNTELNDSKLVSSINFSGLSPSNVSLTIATCTPNRFWSCTSCTDSSCCNNVKMRDCNWDNASRCIPAYDPGHKFWNVEDSTQICAKGISILNSKVSSYNSTMYSNNLIIANSKCYSAGDCGNKYNFFGDFSDLSKKDNDLMTKEFISSIAFKQEQRQNNLNYSKVNYVAELIPSNSNSTNLLLRTNSNSDFISNLYGYLSKIDELLLYDVKDYSDINQINLNFKSGSYSSKNIISECGPWIPDSASCNSCNNVVKYFRGNANYAECTEYKCRSLGKNCVFETNNGVPNCFEAINSSSKLFIENLSANKNNSASSSNYLGKGITLTENLKLKDSLIIKFNTNSDALCKLSYLPKDSFFDISSNDIDIHEFSQNHSFELFFTKDLSALSSIKTYFNVATYSDLALKLVELKYKIDSLKKKYPEIDRYSVGVYPLIEPIVSYYLNTNYQNKFQELFSNMENNTYQVFIKCIDKKNQESNNSYVQFKLTPNCEDTTAPIIIGNQIQSNNLRIYVDEVATCNFDVSNVSYAEMNYSFNCQENPYSISGVSPVKYSCDFEINDENISKLLQKNSAIYVRCKDNPALDHKDTKIILKMKYSAVPLSDSSSEGISDSNAVNFIETANSFAFNIEEISNLSAPITEIYYSNNSKKYLEINFEKPYSCRMNYFDSLSVNQFSCSSSKCVLVIDETNKILADNTISCSRLQDKCNSAVQNYNQNSTMLDISNISNEIISTFVLKDKIFKVGLINSNLTNVECGILTDPSVGYLLMSKVPMNYTKDDLAGYNFYYKVQSLDGISNNTQAYCISKNGFGQIKELD